MHAGKSTAHALHLHVHKAVGVHSAMFDDDCRQNPGIPEQAGAKITRLWRAGLLGSTTGEADENFCIRKIYMLMVGQPADAIDRGTENAASGAPCTGRLCARKPELMMLSHCCRTVHSLRGSMPLRIKTYPSITNRLPIHPFHPFNRPSQLSPSPSTTCPTPSPSPRHQNTMSQNC